MMLEYHQKVVLLLSKNDAGVSIGSLPLHFSHP